MSEPEFRLDPLTREWVAVAGSRQGRPDRPAAEGCPFCVGGIEAPEPYDVKVFENRWPIFRPGEPADLSGRRAPGRGAAEVVLYSPEHDATLATLGREGIRRVVDVWAERSESLLARPEIAYVLVFENRGDVAGATIPHPHGQIYGFPFVPPVPAREAAVAAAEGCPLCLPVAPELVVREGGGWRAHVPFASAWPYGLLLVPAEHVPSLAALDGAGRDGLADSLGAVLGGYDRLFARPFPYMFWIHPGEHLHVHVAPPLRGAETMRWVAAGELGSGTYMNPVVPENAAAALREAVGEG